jgi:hypothetical protein
LRSTVVERPVDGVLVGEIDPGAHLRRVPGERLCGSVRFRPQRRRQQLGDQLPERLALASLSFLEITQDLGVDVDGRSRA